MSSNNLPISDQRMLALMDYAIKEAIALNESQYLEKISFPRTNIGNVKRGHQSFTRDHIYEACKLTGANANWIFGLERNMMRKPAKDPIEQMKEALVSLEQERKPGKRK